MQFLSNCSPPPPPPHTHTPPVPNIPTLPNSTEGKSLFYQQHRLTGHTPFVMFLYLVHLPLALNFYKKNIILSNQLCAFGCNVSAINFIGAYGSILLIRKKKQWLFWTMPLQNIPGYFVQSSKDQ